MPENDNENDSENDNENDSDGKNTSKFPPAIFPPGGIISVMIRVVICHSQIPTMHMDNEERHV